MYLIKSPILFIFLFWVEFWPTIYTQNYIETDRQRTASKAQLNLRFGFSFYQDRVYTLLLVLFEKLLRP